MQGLRLGSGAIVHWCRNIFSHVPSTKCGRSRPCLSWAPTPGTGAPSELSSPRWASCRFTRPSTLGTIGRARACTIWTASCSSDQAQLGGRAPQRVAIGSDRGEQRGLSGDSRHLRGCQEGQGRLELIPQAPQGTRARRRPTDHLGCIGLAESAAEFFPDAAWQ
jgi:hypothetical protein